jgi:hypothetical protein
MSNVATALDFVRQNFQSTGVPAPAPKGLQVRLRQVFDPATRTFKMVQARADRCQCDCPCESPGDF